MPSRKRCDMNKFELSFGVFVLSVIGCGVYFMSSTISGVKAYREAKSIAILDVNRGKFKIVKEEYEVGRRCGWWFAAQGVTTGKEIHMRGPRGMDDKRPQVGEIWLITYRGEFRFDRKLE